MSLNNVELNLDTLRELLANFLEFLQPYWEQFLWNLDRILNRMACHVTLKNAGFA
jgi:hypothetical protein